MQLLSLDSPRVWRTYIGGALLDELHGVPKGTGIDSNYPEEWIMSVISARNTGREEMQEGLSYLKGSSENSLRNLLNIDASGLLGKEHATRYSGTPAVLVKLIDAAERLTIQVHPDRDSAMKLFGSPFGKTECWHILDIREMNGEKACIYLGFKPGIDRAEWERLFRKQDIDGMLASLNRLEVNPGDTILIEGGVPHSIGKGCFLVEIQEPTDYTIRVERTTPAGLAVTDMMCHQGLGFGKMFECFHYDGISSENVRKKWFIKKEELFSAREASLRKLVGYNDTPLFAMNELMVYDTYHLINKSFCGLYLLEGEGYFTTDDKTFFVEAPGQFFLTNYASKLEITALSKTPMRILQCFGPSLRKF